MAKVSVSWARGDNLERDHGGHSRQDCISRSEPGGESSASWSSAAAGASTRSCGLWPRSRGRAAVPPGNAGIEADARCLEVGAEDVSGIVEAAAAESVDPSS